jgi:hypothetical protein
MWQSYPRFIQLTSHPPYPIQFYIYIARPESLGQFERLVLTAILTLGDQAYGVSIHGKVWQLAKP